MTLIDKRLNWDAGNGSALRGYTQYATYGELVKCFGEPNQEGDDDKIAFGWEFIFGRDGRYASIYPYKYCNIKGRCSYHIGGFQEDHPIVVNRVRKMISESRAGKEHEILE
jgi:hypothetical protein